MSQPTTTDDVIARGFESEPEFGVAQPTNKKGTSRCFSITDNSITQQQYDDYNTTFAEFETFYNANTATVKCIAVARDIAPTTNKLHLHIFIQFKVQRSVKQLKSCGLPRAQQYHIMFPSSERHKENIIGYIKQKDHFRIYGVPPISARAASKRGGDATASTFRDTYELAKRGRIDEIDPEMLIKYYASIYKIFAGHYRALDLDGTADEVKTHILWLYGPPGTGKSAAARALAHIIDPGRQPFLKIGTSQWWDTYLGEDIVIVDEMPLAMKQEQIMLWKQWTDRYAFPGQVKGSTLKAIRPKWIFICSNFTLTQVFGHEDKVTGEMLDDPNVQAMERRVTQIYLEKRMTDYEHQIKPLVLGICQKIGISPPEQTDPHSSQPIDERETQPLGYLPSQPILIDQSEYIELFD